MTSLKKLCSPLKIKYSHGRLVYYFSFFAVGVTYGLVLKCYEIFQFFCSCCRSARQCQWWDGWELRLFALPRRSSSVHRHSHLLHGGKHVCCCSFTGRCGLQSWQVLAQQLRSLVPNMEKIKLFITTKHNRGILGVSSLFALQNSNQVVKNEM